ncbi:MAG: EAL domain-containing protein [Elusimicrobia bacterium]|jgi:EAL domain-containing protein (putative c-di-GMP-specific phosphodiesterase class I)|nr:EAL domain-containing protein [Elusimicrobiota bacterium]
MTLEKFIQEGNLRVNLKPVVSIRKKASVGWVARTEGHSGPRGPASRSLAGKEGLAIEFDRWYRKEALAAYKTAGATGLLFLGFETAVLDLGVGGSGHLARQVDELRLNPSDIVISIRESRVEDLAALKEFVTRHRSQGFLIALKDLGIGHSNFERVTLLKPDILIMGNPLVEDQEKDFLAQEIIKALAALSKKIGALLIAEGVATEGQALAALDNGVDMLEGSFFNPETCTQTINILALRYKSFAVEKSKSDKNRVRETEKLLSVVVRALTGIPFAKIETKLADLIKENRSIECLFVLSESGTQESETHTRPEVPFKRNALFHPARPGADHSMKEYAYLLAESFVNRYRTEPYVSQASGNLCVTLSSLFRDDTNKNHILCLDIPWG